MKIGTFDTDREVLVIAEIGNNHEGDFGLAREMIHRAVDAGVGAVKFQTIVPEKLVSSTEAARIQQLKRFQFSYDQFAELSELSKSLGVMFMSTPFDIESLNFLNGIVPAFKIASSDNNFYPLLDAACETGKPIIMSTGISGEKEVLWSVNFLKEKQAHYQSGSTFGILHCVSLYPVVPEKAQLQTIQWLAEQLPQDTIGYSDHTLGTEAAVLSVGLGARIIEKHFTIDKNHSDFRDHQLSADPGEMKHLVEQVRLANTFLGSAAKIVSDDELVMKKAARRSLAAGKDFSPGEIIDAANTTWLRPGTGISPDEAAQHLGKKLNKSISQGQLIAPEDLA